MKKFFQNYKNQVFVSIYAVIALLLCSKSSPLFYFNDWVDANSFFTVGKSMFNGITLYKDIFEQKGPMLYLIHGLGYLISHTTFNGVFAFEAIAFAITLIYAYRLLCLFFNENIALTGTFLLPLFILGAKYFAQGSSAEEYILCAQMVSLYYLANYFVKEYSQNTVDLRHMFIHGLMFSTVLLIKYNIAAFWFFPIATVFISFIIKKQFKKAICSLLVFAAGSFAVIIPWFIYFLVNGALNDFIEVYFLFNAKYYTNSNTNITGVVSLVLTVFKNGVFLLKQFKFEYIALIIGLLSFCLYPFKIKWWQRLSISSASFALVFTAIFFNGTGHIYYTMGITVFFIFTVIAFCKIIEIIKLPLKSWLIAAFAISMLFATVYKNPYHKDSRLFSKENTSNKVQIEFANLMHETDNPTLLNYGFLDGGFFTVADIVPNVRWFQRQNKIFETYPEHSLEHERYIREKVTDYIVRRIKKDYYTGELEEVLYLDENYELIAQKEQHFEGYDFIYFLYRVKN